MTPSRATLLPWAPIPCWAAIPALAAFFPSLALGEDALPVSREEHDRVILELEELRREVRAMREEAAGAPSVDAGQSSGDAPSPSRAPGGPSDKPFLRSGGPRAHLGGYFDVEFRDAENARHDFRLHRLIPFIYADIHERIKFASEIEIEDGSEVEVEFAFIDLLVVTPVNFRGGVILDPIGKFNLIHDSPLNDLTDRPLVDQFVIPTTLREIGVGLFGTLTPPEAEWEVKYEAYLTSGFKGLSDAGQAAITSSNGLRGARPSAEAFGTRSFDDNNNAFAGVGRLSVSPFIGSELGVSAHHGVYDESARNDLTIAAVDGLFTIPQFELEQTPIGPIEILAEGAFGFIERDDLARSAGVPTDLWGYYTQVNYHFMPSFLVQTLPEVFLADSTFTLVGRWDHVDLDGNKLFRTTLGLNYRPIEWVVLKFDYQWNRGTGSAPPTSDDDAFLISLASYF